FDYILTAHHADDSLETFIINLSRGTGLDGLTGIPEKNDKLLRPLLPFTRKEIEHYAKTHNLTWREDASNAETKYLRNKIRHQIIPILKEINPNFLEAFLKTTQHLKESRQLIDEAVVNAKEKIVITTKNKEIQLKMDELKKLKHPKVYLYEILKEYGFTAWKDVANLLEAQSGKEVFSKTHRLLKNRGVLIVSKNLSDKENLEFIIGKNMTVIEANNIKLRISELKDNHVISHLNTIFIDKSKLIWPLVLRKWKTGDYFYPLGMQGKKKVSKYFKDEKFSLLQKETTWLLCSDDKIIWIVNHRLDDRFKVTKNTKTILKIENTHSYSLPEASEEKD
ncbi:MAG TPA: tRNA lysidine(34) synthetase TilS, partial [Flavobacteriaceae bacterium]|nr:tRNA lysidine(34) synthetase TilS [Flavobacteriaceae bacterium]